MTENWYDIARRSFNDRDTALAELEATTALLKATTQAVLNRKLLEGYVQASPVKIIYVHLVQVLEEAYPWGNDFYVEMKTHCLLKKK